jgi:hypothetical protein
MSELFIVVTGYGNCEFPRTCSGVSWSRPFRAYEDAVDFAGYLRDKFGGGVDDFFSIVCDAPAFAMWLEYNETNKKEKGKL